jgi:predicted dehydrogenase
MTDRILVVGLGSIGRRHARVIKQLRPGCEIIALRRSADSGANEPDIDYCVTNLADALRLKPQIAVITNPASHHLSAALPLAEAGVHLLVEKPIAHMSEGVTELIAACRQNNVVLMTAYNLRFLPSLQRFRHLIRERRVGHLLSVRAEVGQYLPSWRPGSDYRSNVSAQAALGGGALLELSHEIDFLRWVFGEIDWVNATLLRQSALEIDVEDTVHLILGFHGITEREPLVASLDIDFVRHDTVRNCVAIGEEGSLRWNGLEGKVEFYEPGSKAWQVLEECPTQRDDSYLAEWRHFLECVESGVSPMVSGEDGLAVLRVIEAARASSASRAIVKVQHS